jgi:hypothetical protein
MNFSASGLLHAIPPGLFVDPENVSKCSSEELLGLQTIKFIPQDGTLHNYSCEPLILQKQRELRF